MSRGRQLRLRRYLLSGGSWVLLGMAINAVVTVGTQAVLARMLDPAALGAFFLVFSLAAVAVQVGQLGLDRGVVRLVAASDAVGSDAETSATIRTVLALALIASLAVVTVGWPLASELLFDAIFATVDIRPLAGAMALWIVAVTVRELVAETFRGFHEIRRATLFSGLVTGAASLAAYVGMWQLDAPVDLAAVVWVATVVAVLVCGLSLWQLASLHPWAEHGDFRSFREVLSISAPLLVVGVSLLLTREAHLWVLASVETERETAVFGVLNRLLLLITMSQLLLNRVMMPTFAALHARKEKPRLERLLQLGAVMASVPALVIVAICLSFGAEVLRLLFGDYYGQHGHAALKIASVGHLINVMSGMAGSLLMMTGHERSVMRTTVVCGIASVFVTYVLVAHVRLGIEGAATGYALGVILTNVALWAIAWRKTGIWTHFTTRRLAEGIRLAAQELDRRRM